MIHGDAKGRHAVGYADKRKQRARHWKRERAQERVARKAGAVTVRQATAQERERFGIQ